MQFSLLPLRYHFWTGTLAKANVSGTGKWPIVTGVFFVGLREDIKKTTIFNF